MKTHVVETFCYLYDVTYATIKVDYHPPSHKETEFTLQIIQENPEPLGSTEVLYCQKQSDCNAASEQI